MGATKSKAVSSGSQRALRNIPGVTPAVPAASVLVMLPNGENDIGFKVLMVKRASTMKFMPDSYVFPGGKVDLKDEAVSIDPEEVPEVFSHAPVRVAALRELGEEVGLTLDREGTFKSTKYYASGPQGARLLVPFAHWVTPIQEKKRFDTWFFALSARHDLLKTVPVTIQPEEIADHKWVSPQEALDLHANKDSGFKLPPPTYLMMHKLSHYKTALTVMHEHQIAYGMAMDSEMPPIQPILRVTNGVFEMHLPKGHIHLEEGVHKFPGNYLPPSAVPEGTDPIDYWLVKIGDGSELIDPRTNTPIASIPEGGAAFNPEDLQSIHTKG